MAKSYHLLVIFISQSTHNLSGCIISVYLFILSLFRDRALLSVLEFRSCVPSFFKHWDRVVYALVPGTVFLFKGSRVPLHLSVSADSTSCEAWEGFSNDSYFHGYFHNFSYKRCVLSVTREST